MSGLSIDHGGAIAVDTGQLREVALRLQSLGSIALEAQRAAQRAMDAFWLVPWSDLAAAAASAERVATALGTITVRIDESAVDTLLMADAYDVVELRAQVDALTHTDAAAAAAVTRRLDHLLASDERLAPLADAAEREWKSRRFRGLGEQFDAGGLLPPIFLAGAFVGMASGLGKVRPGMILRGSADPVRLAAVKSSPVASAPAGFADALHRLPGARGAQVAVEKYTMPGGSARYVAYVSGSRTMSLGDAGGA